MFGDLGNDFCYYCGKDYQQTNYNQKYCCDECQRAAHNENQKKRYAKRKKQREANKSKNDLDSVLAELREYNEKNNCCISYGQFVLLKEKAGESK